MKQNTFKALEVVETIYQRSEDSRLEPVFFEEVKEEIEFLSEYTGVSPLQAVFFAIAVIISYENGRFDTVFKHLGLEKYNVIRYNSDLKALFKAGLIQKEGRRSRLRTEFFEVNDNVLTCLAENLPIEKPKSEKLDFIEVLERVSNLNQEYHTEDLPHFEFVYLLGEIIKENRHLKTVKEIDLMQLKPYETYILIDTIWDALKRGDNDFNTDLQDTVSNFHKSVSVQINLMNRVNNGDSLLIKKKLIEIKKSDFRNRTSAKISKKIIQLLKDNDNIIIDDVTTENQELLSYKRIGKKNLFYNENEEKEIATIKKLTTESSYKKLRSKLKDKNMPVGVTVLLYGSPGTGKTESIYQLARETKRNIFKVDISATKSMWFGESQKLIKKIFTDYARLKSTEKNCPILMLNEADAVIGKRKAAGSSNTADTENQIQNILLEELENFDGILFATTNLINNLDSAFERRFLFKVKFDAPKPENAARIWKNKLPFLTQKESLQLAKDFRFSGGEIENIARKCEIEELVLGKENSYEAVVEFCENEKWNDTASHSPIGFIKNAS